MTVQVDVDAVLDQELLIAFGIIPTPIIDPANCFYYSNGIT